MVLMVLWVKSQGKQRIKSKVMSQVKTNRETVTYGTS